MMSFDRVLPKPPALYDDSPRAYRSSSSLLEHKIMNDTLSEPPADRVNPGYLQYICNDNELEPGQRPTSASSLQISTMNRETVAHNESVSLNFSSKEGISRMTDSISPQDRSISSSPSKLEPSLESATQFCLCQPDPKIPRPRNAFILYRQHNQAAVVAQNPGLANPEISKIIGERWRTLPPEKKEEWKALAEIEKVRHQQQYPDYRYQPRRMGRDGTVKNPTNAAFAVTSSGTSICTRCGGRLINAPHSPMTPSKPGAHLSITHSRSPKPRNIEHSLHSHGYYGNDVSHRLNKDLKRRRTIGHHISKTMGQESLSDMEGYHRIHTKSHLSRSGASNLRSRGGSPTTSLPSRWAEDEKYYDRNIILPPLQTNRDTPGRTNGLDRTSKSLSFFYKIKILSSISPPLSITPSNQSPGGRGAIIAVDGQHSALINTVVRSLGKLLTKDGKYAIRVFEGPEPLSHTGGSAEGGIGDYLQVIETWHRISKEIIQFVSHKNDYDDMRMVDDSNSDFSPAPRLSGEGGGSRSPSGLSSDLSMALDGRDKLGNGMIAGGSSPIPIALVPQYQLTTADAFARVIPINDRYNPVEHWQWMASLWRGCVGPDATVYIKDCGPEEIGQYGNGNNPVEVRLNDARTLVVRRFADSPLEIEEKALRRVGFEIEELLAR